MLEDIATAPSDRAVPAAGPLLPIAVALAAVAAAAFFGWQMWIAAVTPDLHWLLSGGRLLIQQLGLPAVDPFSWSAAERPVVFYQWLFMVALAAVDALLGVKGLMFLQIAAGVIIYLMAPLVAGVPRRVPAIFTIVIGCLALAVTTVNFGLRPMVATSALLLLQYCVVQAWRRGRIGYVPVVLLIAIIYAAWANLHNGVVIGLGSLALCGAGDQLQRWNLYRFAPADPAVEGDGAAPGRYAVLGFVALTATLANPYGVGIYAHLLQFSEQSALAGAIVELRSPDFHIAQFRWFLILVGLAGVTLMGARRAFSGSDLLHLAAFTLATLVCARFVVWAVLFYALILPRALHHLITARGNLRPELRDILSGSSAMMRRWTTICVWAGALALAGWLVATTQRPGDLCDRYAPVLARDAATAPAGGRWFASAELGSCAIGMTPGRRVFVDTRFDVYGDEIAGDMLALLRLEPRWDDVLRRWRFERLVVEKSWPLAQLIERDPQFRVLYEDEVALIAVPN